MGFNWGNAGSGAASGAAAGSTFGPWGTAIGGVAGGLFGGFSGDDDEEDKTNELLSQIPEQLKQYLTPYVNAGMGALPNLNELSGEYANLYKDPNAIISRIGSGYRQSPGYQWKLNQGENAITNAAARGGYAGTPQHQQYAGELAGNLADQDYQDYLGKALALMTGGLQGRTGIEQGIFDTGAGAAGSLGTGLANYLMGSAGLNYKRGAAQNQMNSDMFSSLLSFFKK
jgi:hypothetical protein